MAEAIDPFRITDRLDTGALDVMVTRLEPRGHHPYFAKPLSDYLDRMAIDRRAEVLDLGCEAYVKLVPCAGLLGGGEMAAWLAELLDASARNEFFGSCAFYAYIARPT